MFLDNETNLSNLTICIDLNALLDAKTDAEAEAISAEIIKRFEGSASKELALSESTTHNEGDDAAWNQEKKT